MEACDVTEKELSQCLSAAHITPTCKTTKLNPKMIVSMSQCLSAAHITPTLLALMERMEELVAVPLGSTYHSNRAAGT